MYKLLSLLQKRINLHAKYWVQYLLKDILVYLLSR